MKRQIHYCSICGVSSELKTIHKNKKYGDYLCEKHYQQFKNYGKFLDNSSRGVFDKNEIRKFDDYAEIDTYDSHGNVVATFKLDLDDIEKLGTRKWRTIFKSNKPYLITGNQNSEKIYFHRLILNNPEEQVDHISGDTLDNRKCNLRKVSLQDNMCNLRKKSNNTSGVRGISYNKAKNRWTVDFTYKKQRFYIKTFSTIEEAIYVRYNLELIFNSKLRNTINDDFILSNINKLSEEQKNCLDKYINDRINTLKNGVKKI